MLRARDYVSRSAALPKMDLSGIFLAVLFTAFLMPFSIGIGGEGISANYSFLLLPAVIALATGKLQLPSKKYRQIMIIYVAIFMLATIFQPSYIGLFDRRVASFVIFMSAFAYMFIKIELDMVRSFKVAIVVISVLLTFHQLFRYFSLDVATLGDAGKDAVGTQRIGFIYILGFWLLLQFFPKGKILLTLKFICLAIVLAGLLLTFSRSSIVALIGSVGLYVAYEVLKWLKRPKPLKKRAILGAASLIIAFLPITVLLVDYVPTTFEFFADRLFSTHTASGAETFDFDNPEASEGYRIFIFKKIVEYVAFNPFTGSGYLGVWIMFENAAGSAHSQYTDVLFRTGVFGFLAYAFLIIKLLNFLRPREPGLFWGVVGILIYGLFHETFKESQGGVILAFLLGMMASFEKKSSKST